MNTLSNLSNTGYIALVFSVFVVINNIRRISLSVNGIRKGRQLENALKLRHKPEINPVWLILIVLMTAYCIYNLYKIAHDLPIVRLIYEDPQRYGRTPEEASKLLSAYTGFRNRVIIYIIANVFMIAGQAALYVGGRYIYMTNVGIYVLGVFFRAEEFIYRFTDTPNGRKLELTRSGTLKPMVLTVPEDSTRLEAMLAENYKLFW